MKWWRGQGEARPEIASARSNFRAERLANGRPDWTAPTWMCDNFKANNTTKVLSWQDYKIHPCILPFGPL